MPKASAVLILRKASMLILFSLVVRSVEAQNPIDITTTAVPFLRIPPDARSGGMGDLCIGTTPNDANSVFVNPAKTVFASDAMAAAANYTPWLSGMMGDMYLATLAGYHKLDEQQALTASFRYFSLGNVPLTDYSGNKLKTAHPRELSFDLGYARKLSSALAISLGFRYIYSNLVEGNINGTDYKPGQAVVANISLYYQGLNKEGLGWSGGLSLSNLGSRISYTRDAITRDFIPATAGIGGAYTMGNASNKIMLGLDLNKLLVPALPYDSAGRADYYSMSVSESWSRSFSHPSCQVSAGAEYRFEDLFSARAGYHYEDLRSGGLTYFTAGAGIQYKSMGFDLSYLVPSGNGTARSPLANSLRLGVLFKW